MKHLKSRRMLAALALATAFASLAMSVGADRTSASAKYPCKAKHAELLKKRGYVRVFRLRRDERDPSGRWQISDDVFVCDGRVGRWFPLYPADIPEQAGVIRISGEFVGFEFGASCGQCYGDTTIVGVIDAATGHRPYTRTRDAELGEGDFDITDMVLEPNGSIAFIAIGNWRSSSFRTRTVVRHDCYGARILQQNRKIRARSLKLESGMLRWRADKRLRTATIC